MTEPGRLVELSLRVHEPVEHRRLPVEERLNGVGHLWIIIGMPLPKTFQARAIRYQRKGFKRAPC